MKPFRRAALAATAAALLLTACSPAADAPPSDAATAATGDGLTVTNARVVLPAVGGNPAAVYFDLSYNGAPGVALTGVVLEGAGMTMIHDYAENAGKMQMVMAEDVPLNAGAPVSFAPGGLHVMAMEPSDALKAGGSAQVTLLLSDGKKITLEAPVHAAGDER